MSQSTPTLATVRNIGPLARAVIRQLGGGRDAIQSALEAAEHGADGGFSGFVYHNECRAFVRRNRGAIVDSLRDMAESCGESVAGLVTSFRCLRDDKPSDAMLAVALYGARESTLRGTDADGMPMLYSALAWYALEETGRAIESMRD